MNYNPAKYFSWNDLFFLFYLDQWTDWEDVLECEENSPGAGYFKQQSRTCKANFCQILPKIQWKFVKCEPINGEWSAWSEFGSCVEDDDDGWWYKTKDRTCSNPEPKFGGEDCQGESKQRDECQPEDGAWTDWEIGDGDCFQDDNGEWTKLKTRKCEGTKYGGNYCAKESGYMENGSYVCDPGRLTSLTRKNLKNIVENFFLFFYRKWWMVRMDSFIR